MNTVTKSILQNITFFKRGNFSTRLVASVLLGVVVVAQLATPVAAVAAVPDSQGDMVIPDASCHVTWTWQVGNQGVEQTPYSQIKWTANPCGYLIRNRSQCLKVFGGKYYTAPSGIVKRVGLKARTYCNNMWQDLKKGQYQWKRPGGEWSPWITFWHD